MAVNPSSLLTPSTRRDELVAPPSERLEPQLVKQLSTLRPWRSLGQVFLEWVLILVPIVLCHQFWHPLLYGAVVIWVGARQHALGILMHEATHYRLAKNRLLNELIGHVFLAFPIFASYRGFRATHFAHHRSPNTEQDPDWTYRDNQDWVFPKSRAALYGLLLRDAFALNTHEFPKLGRRYARAANDPTWLNGVRLAGYLLVVGICWYCGLLTALAVYWLVPYLTTQKLFMRIRNVSEHHGLKDYGDPYSETRTTIPSWWERLLISPYHVGYHLDHHLYPSVPFYNLPKLHRALMECDAYRTRAHITETYRQVLRECQGLYAQDEVTPVDAAS